MGYILCDDAVHAQLEKGLDGQYGAESIVESLFYAGKETGNEQCSDYSAGSLYDTGC